MVVIQVKPMYRKPEEGHGHTGRELDKDDTWRLLIEARSTVLHTEAGYTTDNLLLPSKLMLCNEGGDHIRPSRLPILSRMNSSTARRPNLPPGPADQA
jgi:hypothetical protein